MIMTLIKCLGNDDNMSIMEEQFDMTLPGVRRTEGRVWTVRGNQQYTFMNGSGVEPLSRFIAQQGQMQVDLAHQAVAARLDANDPGHGPFATWGLLVTD